jgi:hypothetical protein
MINEHDLAEKFSVIWTKHFPLLTANFIRVFNETRVKIINTQSIPISDGIRYDLIAEVSFNISEEVFISGKKISQILSNNRRLEQMVKAITDKIWKIGSYTDSDLLIPNDEIEEITKISNNIIEFIAKIKKNDLLFKPKLKGYGFIPDLEADVLIDDTLYEIKTVNRNFKSSDLKQLLIYLALNQVSNSKKWDYAGLYNPRKGTYCRFNVKSLVYNLTGGKTPNEAFESLLNELVRDIQIDSKF